MSDHIRKEKVRAALKKSTGALVSQMNSAGHWSGELSSSALSTAVAVIALHSMRQHELVLPGLRWLAANVNTDGGWGDTVCSKSNLSTTALVWAAFGGTGSDREFSTHVSNAENWLWRAAGSRENLVSAIIERYGKDRTFSVPILMTLALSGRLESAGWRRVLPLPFEIAALPQSWFGALQLPVVSYALPALIAIGQAIHHQAPARNPFARFTRNLLKGRTLDRLAALQPSNGGFLEATPLTAFVTMSLASMGLQNHAVAQAGAGFLKRSVRNDGSWPIDTNLSTWVTTLSVKALAHQPDLLSAGEKRKIKEWLLAQQYRRIHPYTRAAPGGWAWTNLPGGVPDADDTAGALLALRHLGEADPEMLAAMGEGITWLLDLQNRDGGIPTFCRGWGALPFDRSSPELTVHAMEAFAAWEPHLDLQLKRRVHRALRRAYHYLLTSQRTNGSWVPLWFGNEHAIEQENPVYGTARTLQGLRRLNAGWPRSCIESVARAENFLRATQLPTGGWGGDRTTPESLEETALASESLDDLRGLDRLAERVLAEDWQPAPVGLYFARLWYYERLYPLIFATSALGAKSKQF